MGVMGARSDDIDLTCDQRALVSEMLEQYLPGVEVWAYGSRAKFSSQTTLDLDLVAFAGKDQELAVFTLREAFEESYLPFRVDLFVWDEVPEQFRRNIENEKVVLQSSHGRAGADSKVFSG